MKKKKYEEPEMEIIEFDNQDAIITSTNPSPEGGGTDP